jgi:hypothetical protein
MSACTDYIKTIYPDECVGDSLSTINSNFSALQVVTCELEQRFDKNKQVRTFFYYGPNARLDATSGMADNSTSRPSDLTIQAFVNSPEQLNLPLISRDGDTAYVVYQKTGFKNTVANVNGTATSSVVGTIPGTYNYGAPFNPSPDVYPVSHGAWSWFMNRYAVWVNPATNVATGVTHTRYRKLYIYADDTYTFSCQADNHLDWYVDGTFIASAQGFTSNIVSRNIFLKAGLHTLQFNAVNVANGFGWDRNPAGWACTISDSKGVIWDTRTYSAGEANYIPVGPQSTTTPTYVQSNNTTSSDIITYTSPVLIIWKLTYSENSYTVDVGFPKFTRASTNNSNFTNWNNPTAWSQY